MPTTKRSEEECIRRLYESFSALKNEEEAEAYLLDVMSTKEIEDLAQRLEVASMLAQGASYVEVSKTTGASSTTVSRVSKCLQGDAGGYQIILDRIGL